MTNVLAEVEKNIKIATEQTNLQFNHLRFTIAINNTVGKYQQS